MYEIQWNIIDLTSGEEIHTNTYTFFTHKTVTRKDRTGTHLTVMGYAGSP